MTRVKNLLYLLYSFYGRIGRAQWWLCTLANVTVFLVLVFVFGEWLPDGVRLTVTWLAAISVLMSCLALNGKRLRDVGVSPYSVLLLFLANGLDKAADKTNDEFLAFLLAGIALAISLVFFVLLGFIRGKKPGLERDAERI